MRPSVLLPALWAALLAAAGEGWFGLSLDVKAGGPFWSPRVESITVSKVVPNSPADQQRLAAGDAILEIEGMAVAGAKADELKARMRKSIGEKLNLKLKRSSGEVYRATLVAVAKPKDAPQ